jgi:hypothetical protein
MCEGFRHAQILTMTRLTGDSLICAVPRGRPCVRCPTSGKSPNTPGGTGSPGGADWGHDGGRTEGTGSDCGGSPLCGQQDRGGQVHEIGLGQGGSAAKAAAQTGAARFVETFKEFPPIQKPGSFTIDDAIAKMGDATAGAS